MEAMMHDKKFAEGTMVFIVPVAIGKVEINKSVSAAARSRDRGTTETGGRLRMSVRGIRGAITVEDNEEQPILQATVELLNGIVTANNIAPEDICSVFVTVTGDLDDTFPCARDSADGRLGAGAPNVCT